MMNLKLASALVAAALVAQAAAAPAFAAADMGEKKENAQAAGQDPEVPVSPNAAKDKAKDKNAKASGNAADGQSQEKPKQEPQGTR